MRIDRRTEAIVYVDDGDAARAGVEHGQQGRDAPERCAVANGGRNGNDGTRDQSGDNARQCAFHSGADDQSMGVLDDVESSQKPVQARDADIVQALSAAAMPFQGQGRFFADRRVRRPGRQHGDIAFGIGRVEEAHHW